MKNQKLEEVQRELEAYRSATRLDIHTSQSRNEPKESKKRRRVVSIRRFKIS